MYFLSIVKQVENVVFSVGPYPFMIVMLGHEVFTKFICLVESTSPPVNKTLTFLKILGFCSIN